MIKRLALWILWIIILVIQCLCKPEDIPIGGLFKEGDSEQHLAFLHAIEYVNEEKILHPHKLVGDGKLVNPDNEFRVSQTVCNLFGNGVLGIFGPTSGTAADYVQSMCDNKEIPHIEVRSDVQQFRDALMVNLYPYPPVLAKVYVDIIRTWSWKSFTVLYENFHDLPHINELLKMYDRKGYAVNIRQLDVDHSGNFRPILTEAKRAGETHFVLECSIENLTKIMTQLQQVGLLSDSHHYIIMHPDMHTIDLSPYQFGGSNITGVRIVDPDDENIIEVATELHERMNTYDPINEHFLGNRSPQNVFRSKTALLYDAVYLFATALKDLNRHHLTAKQLFCNTTDNWEHGYSVINFMKTKTLKGLTGEIKFDHQGFRSDFVLDVVELSINGLIKIGLWNSTEGLNITRPIIEDDLHDDGSLHNRTFTVLISLTEPYGMLKDSSIRLEGNDRFEGFGIDLIKELGFMLGFNYTFKLHPNSVYGGYDKKSKSWTGMIRELMDFRGDLAITDFTITSERESGVDFTMPFMNLGISILYKKPMKMPPKLFSFTSPFSMRVWTWLGGAYFFVSLMLFVVGRISPAEWTNPFPCIEEPDNLFNQFSMKNCFWFTMGSLMQQGSEIAPIGIATRMIAGLWWFFTLIMVSSYTANLAAFLTVESLFTPVKSIEDLATAPGVQYGAKSGGATANFFRDSNYSVYKKIWEHMETHPDEMTSENPKGVEKADQENYAFLMESTSIEYTIERFCNLTQVGGLLDNKGYGIAMRKNSTYRNLLSAAVLKLQETGRLAVLKNKWWKEKKGGGKCHDDSSSDGADELSLQNVGGVFLVLVVGSIGGIFVAFAELSYGVCRRSFSNDVSFKEEFITELKFFVQCQGQTKPNTCRKSTSMSPAESSKSLRSAENPYAPNYGFVPELQKKKSASASSKSRSRRPSKLTQN